MSANLILLVVLFLLNTVSIAVFNNLQLTVALPQGSYEPAKSIYPILFPIDKEYKQSIPEIKLFPGEKVNKIMIALCVLLGLITVYIFGLLKVFPKYNNLAIIPLLLILVVIICLSIAAIIYYLKIDYSVFDVFNTNNNSNPTEDDIKIKKIVNQVFQYLTFSLNIIIGTILLVKFYRSMKF
jgi:hypothetical protein